MSVRAQGNRFITNNDFEKHKHVKSNETMFRRFGDIMTPLSRNRKNKSASSKGVRVL